MHRVIAERALPGERILEIGSGTLNHIPYESCTAVYDAIEPFRELFEDSPHRGRLSNLYSDIEDVPAEMRYDRVLSIAVLEHVEHLPLLIARSALLLNERGRFQAGIPSEGGILWNLSWRVSTGVAFRLKTGLAYSVLMRWEHINSAAEIEALTRHFFRNVSIRRFPSAGRHLSFYTVIDATAPDQQACRRFLVESTHI
jgi:hypothetical protein